MQYSNDAFSTDIKGDGLPEVQGQTPGTQRSPTPGTSPDTYKLMDPDTDVDDVLRVLGRWGRFQWTQILLLFVGIWATGFQLLSGVVTGYRPLYECKTPYESILSEQNLSTNTNRTFVPRTVNIGKCDITIVTNISNTTSTTTEKCSDGYTYSRPRDRSFVTEWDLVCDGAELAEFSQTLVMAGQLVGAAFFTSLSDRFGRKTINVFSNFGLFTVGLGMAYVPNYTTFAVLRFFIGALQQGLVMTTSIMILELMPREHRFFSEIFGALMWSTGVCMLSMIGYLMRDCGWRTIQIVLSAYSCYSLIQYFIQEESLRWLLVNNKIKQAERIVRKAAKLNKLNYEEVIKEVERRKKEKNTLMEGEQMQADMTSSTEKEFQENGIKVEVVPANITNEYKVKRYNATYLFREKRILINSLILWLTWITDSMTYFALTLTSTSLAGNRYLNFFLMSVVEYPAVILEYICLNRIGRKGTTIMFHVTAGVSLGTATVCKYYSDDETSLATASTVFTLIGKMAITGGFSTMFLYTPEMYPTNLRNVGIGFSSSAARIGAMLAPFAGVLALHISWAPGAIVGSLCIIVSFLCLYLPETKGFELPKTMEELHQWYKDHSGTKSWTRKKT